MTDQFSPEEREVMAQALLNSKKKAELQAELDQLTADLQGLLGPDALAKPENVARRREIKQKMRFLEQELGL